MKKKFTVAFFVLLALAAITLSILYLSTRSIPVLEPKGMIAEKQRELIITASLLMLIVVIPVFFLTLIFAWRYNIKNAKGKHTPDWEHNNIAEICWWGVPLVIIVILAVITYKSSHELNPFKPIVNGKPPVTVQAVALDWKWLFIYPEQGIATINYLQIPVDTPINFEITADAPMNSFWIPDLGGQIYAMPAMRTKLHLIANEIGEYRGASANISGKGFAGMYFKTDVTSEEDFNRFVGRVQMAQEYLDRDKYRNLVKPSEDDPVSYFRLGERGLFDQIIEQYKSNKNRLSAKR